MRMEVINSCKVCFAPLLAISFLIAASSANGYQRNKTRTNTTSQKARGTAPKPAATKQPEAKLPPPITISGPVYFAEKLPSPTGRFPENTSVFTLRPEYDTDKFCENPRDHRYGGRLPYIGDSTYQELWQSIDDIYVITMNHIWSPVTNVDRRILPNETLESLSKRLQDPVTSYINRQNEERARTGRMPLTVDYTDSLKVAAVQAWSSVTITDEHYSPDGKATGSFVGIDAGFVASGGSFEGVSEAFRIARNVLSSAGKSKVTRSRGIFLPCGPKTYFSIALCHLAGVISVSEVGFVRPTSWTSVGKKQEELRKKQQELPGHSWGAIVFKEGNVKARLKLMGKNPKGFIPPADCPFDMTGFSQSPGEWEMARRAKGFPRPQFGIASVGHPAARILFDAIRLPDTDTYIDPSDVKRLSGAINYNKDIRKADISSIQNVVNGFDSYTGRLLTNRE